MNHCTLWLEGWWSGCCRAHDEAYAEQAGRAVADFDLFACVAASVPAVVADSPVIASMAALASAVIAGGMYAAVRVFGWRFYRR